MLLKLILLICGIQYCNQDIKYSEHIHTIFKNILSKIYFRITHNCGHYWLEYNLNVAKKKKKTDSSIQILALLINYSKK